MRRAVNDLPFELFVAVRYLLARRKQAFISLISLISAVGVAVGVMALLIVLALMTGLQGELRDRIVGSAAHVYVLKAGGLGERRRGGQEGARACRASSARRRSCSGWGWRRAPAAASSSRSRASIPSLEPGVTNVGRSMTVGEPRRADAGRRGRWRASSSARTWRRSLGVSLGDGVEVLTPEGTLTPFGVSARQRAFKVVGMFSLGLFEFDNSYGFVHLTSPRGCSTGATPDLIEVKVDDLFAAQASRGRHPGPTRVRTTRRRTGPT